MPKGVKTNLTPEQAAEKKAKAQATKAENFIRIAKGRMTKALSAIAQLEALAGASYVSTEAQVGAMITALDKAVTRVADKFAGPKGKAETGGFDFDALNPIETAITPVTTTENTPAE